MPSRTAQPRVAAVCLILGALCCYVEWPGHSAFGFQLAYDVFVGPERSVSNFLHPLVLAPVIGLAFALASAVLPRPRRWMLLAAIAAFTPFMAIVLLVGLLKGNVRMVLSVLPFFACAIWCARTARAERR